MAYNSACPYTYSTFPNGLRLVHVRRKGEVEYFGMVINTGSRDENENEHGLAHFVEHTIFKGTRKRRSWHIINRMESVGGELNAYTTKEETVLYTVFPKGNLHRAAELCSDLISASVFPEKELKKEREVVKDEICSYLDSPSESIFDDFDERIFAGSSMAHNILGSEKNVDSFTSNDCRRWIDSRYSHENIIIFYTGASGELRVREMVNDYFGFFNHPASVFSRTTPLINCRFDLSIEKSLHQNHTVAGVRVPGITSPLRPAVALLCNMIGGPGMNSILNLEMREKRGLVYSVDASSVFYSDCGLLSIYYGCDHEESEKCRDILRNSLGTLHTGITPRKLESAKKQLIGQLALARQNGENNAISSARQILYFGKVASPKQSEEEIRAITMDDFWEAAANLTQDNLSFLSFK
ncbi:MAG: insulinase family protein [Paramuribaculum sp.]|nr:insulinase family protein [Paramuribaculum sp.]